MAEGGGFWGHLWDDSGIYFGADLGQYTWDLDQNGLDQDVVDALGDEGLVIVNGGSDLSDDGFTWGLILGYQLFPFLAFEAAYVDLGSAEYKAGAARPFVTIGNAKIETTTSAGVKSTTFDADLRQFGVRYDLSKRTVAYAMMGETKDTAASLAATSLAKRKFSGVGVAHSF
jgi:hypothetical protein